MNKIKYQLEHSDITLEVAQEDLLIGDHRIGEGHIMILQGDKLIGTANGWAANEALYVFTPQESGKWEGAWTYKDELPGVAEEARALRVGGDKVIDGNLAEIAFEMDIEHLKEHDKAEIQSYMASRQIDDPEMELYLSDEPIIFTDMLPGEDIEAGEHGYYTEYHPTDIPGIYEIHHTSTEPAMPGEATYDQMAFLTSEDYARLRAESDQVIAEGTQYRDEPYGQYARSEISSLER